MAQRILVVDDEEKIAELLEKFLQKQGYLVTRLNDASRAIELLHSEKFDLLITDMKMPGLTGLDLIEKKRKLGISIPVIVLTGSIDAEKYCERGVFRDAGCTAEDICYKPIDLFNLLECVKRKLPAEGG